MVATVHAEAGAANASALLAILERIQPEVIFLECPPGSLDHYLNTPRKLESIAINQYRQLHRVALIPVDLPTPEDDFFRRHRDLDDRLGRSGPVYGQLIYRHGRYVREYGFAYLNSEHCSEFWAKLHEVTLAAIDTLADRTLAEDYAFWITTNKLRDKGMKKNIENYSRKTSFGNAALLVGAAHRQSLMDLARGQSAIDSNAIRWESFEFFGDPNRELGQ